MKKPVTRVSDHAVLRFLERVKGLDIEAVRSSIGRRIDVASDHPGASAVISGGFRYHLQNGVVVSVTPARQPDRATGRKRKG